MALLAPAPPARPSPTPPARDPRRRTRRTSVPFAARQGLLLAAAACVYFAVRHLTAGSAPVAERNADLLVALERSVGVFAERDLQRAALELDGMVAFVNAVYIWGHWPVIAGVMGWLAWRHREAFVVYRNALLLSGLVGMVIVATFPVAPPRLTDLGFLDTVTAHSEAYRVLQPPSFTNQYAAMPSFHVGWDLLVGLALVREGRNRWVRAAGAVLPGLMVLAVVVTGNHYFADAVAGDVIVLGSLWVASRSRSGSSATSPDGAGQVAREDRVWPRRAARPAEAPPAVAAMR